MDADVKKQFKKVDQRFDELLITIKDGFDDVSGRFDKVDGRLEKVEGRLDRVEGRLDRVEGEIKGIKSTMITKEYLDDKLADLGAEIGRRINEAIRKEEAFHSKLLTILKRNNILQPADVQELERMLVR